jgi:kojibiose phosphorylase
MNSADNADWIVANVRTDAPALDQFASVCNVSNGYLGLGGRLAEQRWGRCPMTIINGVYDEIDQFGTLGPYRPDQRYLDPEQMKHPRKSPAIANLPDPLAIRVFLDDEELIFDSGSAANFRQTLDLRCGLYSYEYESQDAHGRATRIEMQRFAALKHAHRVHMRYRVTPLNHTSRITIWSGIDGATLSNTTRERQYEIRRKWTASPEQLRLHAVTPARKQDVFLAVTQRILDAAPPAPPDIHEEERGIYAKYVFAAAPGQGITLERSIVLSSSEDARHRVSADLEKECQAASSQGFAAALTEQTAAWRELWDRADVRVEGDDLAQLYLRFCIFNLLAAAPRFTDRLSVPVKLLSGEYYQGNTFYDTELYIIPFYALVAPEFARTCLRYRHHGLVAGRAIARGLGQRGAKFAWQSGPYGEECLGPWYRFVHTNIHVDADVAYALMQYHAATGDDEFLQECGLDILVESARFYHSRAALNLDGGGQSLADVAGPDEGHCESTNNFHTNYLAKKTLRRAADEIERLRTQDPAEYKLIAGRLRLDRVEPDNWRETADRLRILQDSATKVFEQCEGFFQLPLPPGDLLENRAEWFTTVSPYQALNQPDVLLAMSLFPDEFDDDTWRVNYDYYRKLSMNFSSMSFAVNALTALRMGDIDEAYAQFLIAAGMDLDESLTGRRDTHQGLHGTAMGGAWQAAIFGFAGVILKNQELSINPRLPRGWKSMKFQLAVRGGWIRVQIDRDEMRLIVSEPIRPKLSIRIAGREVSPLPGEEIRIPISRQ